MKVTLVLTLIPTYILAMNFPKIFLQIFKKTIWNFYHNFNQLVKFTVYGSNVKYDGSHDRSISEQKYIVRVCTFI